MDIFLSYASEQRAVAEDIALALRGEGHSVFFDRSALPEGEAYNARIREAIDACDLFVFLVSPEAVSAGRYTLTELRFAETKWPSPAGRLLPVMVQPTDGPALPAYLRAVVILRPAGNIAAEVVAAVNRVLKPPWVRLVRRYAAPVVLVVLVGGGLGAWQAVEHERKCDQASGLVEAAKLHQGAGDYGAAWDRVAEASALCPGSENVAHGQAQLAIDWLDNIRVTLGKETFTAIVDKVQPALSRAAVDQDPKRAADALAHLGWADFLRSREGHGGLDPVGYYEQALARDAQNPYAHAFWGHYLLVTGGSADQAKAHFEQALGTAARRPFVRGIQISALLWQRNLALQDEVFRVVNDMRIRGESLPAGGSESLVSRLWSEYYDRLIHGNGKAAFLAALSAPDHLATFLWLFPAYAASSNREPYLLMVAQLQERNGNRSDALTSYQAVLAAASESGAAGSSIVETARRALRRLRSR